MSARVSCAETRRNTGLFRCTVSSSYLSLVFVFLLLSFCVLVHESSLSCIQVTKTEERIGKRIQDETVQYTKNTRSFVRSLTSRRDHRLRRTGVRSPVCRPVDRLVMMKEQLMMKRPIPLLSQLHHFRRHFLHVYRIAIIVGLIP